MEIVDLFAQAILYNSLIYLYHTGYPYHTMWRGTVCRIILVMTLHDHSGYHTVPAQCDPVPNQMDPIYCFGCHVWINGHATYQRHLDNKHNFSYLIPHKRRTVKQFPGISWLMPALLYKTSKKEKTHQNAAHNGATKTKQKNIKERRPQWCAKATEKIS